jgi:dihydropteroate synthase
VKSVVAEAALAAGAHIVNDVSGFTLDAGMASVCARAGAGVIVMHSRGGVADMASFAHATYDVDVLEEVLAELRERVARVVASGVDPACVAIDPGIGFAKRGEHSLRLLGCIDRFVATGHPVVVGASRKRFVGEITGVSDAAQRGYGSVGAAVSALERGAQIFRVHDVAATRQALDVAAAIGAAGTRCA